MRVDVLPVGSRQPAARIRMGWKRPGRTLTPQLDAAGRHSSRPATTSRACTPSTARGRTLRRTATASGRSR